MRMQVKNSMNIKKAKGKDARAAKDKFIPRGYYETIEILCIETRESNSLKSLDGIIDKVCLFSKGDFDYSRIVLKAAENAYQRYQREERQNPGTDLQWLNFIRRCGLFVQKKREALESFKSFARKYYQWRQGNISGEQLLSATKYFGVKNAS